MLGAASAKLKKAISTLTDDTSKGFCRAEDPLWSRICDCAMLGALHRTLHSQTWYQSGVQDWESQLTISVRQFLYEIEGVRTATIQQSGMSQMKPGGRFHDKCTLWPNGRINMEWHSSVGHEHFEKQRAKSGVTDGTSLRGGAGTLTEPTPVFFCGPVYFSD